MDDIILGAKQLPNPKNIKPKLDTESPDPEDKITVPMDMHNPNPIHFGPNPHPIERYYKHPPRVRHQLGRGVPKVSEN